MRIIHGNHKGKKINPPEGLPVRPTTDMAKESLFNILNNYFYFDGIKVLDLCAGTGSISYEFAARGAQSVLSVDIDGSCVKFMEKTARELDFTNMRVIKADLIHFLGNCMQKFNIIFADPPYALEQLPKLPDLILREGWLTAEGLFILEHGKENDFSDAPGFVELRTYGAVHFSFFERK